MKAILIPTDFSDNSWNAIFTAIKLYAKLPCRFFILNVYGANVSDMFITNETGMPNTLYETLAAESKEGLSKITDYIKKNLSNPKHTFEVLQMSGDLVGAIKEVLLEKDIEGIIMGTKGATGLKKVFMGSTTVKVIREIRNCPVIAVPEDYNFQTLRYVVFPTDFTRFYDKSELQTLIELIRLWKAKIKIFQAAQEFLMSDNQIANKKILQKCFKDEEHDIYNVQLQTTVEKAIEDFATTSSADMIALIHYRHTFLAKLTREHIINKLGFQAKIPLLILPELS